MCLFLHLLLNCAATQLHDKMCLFLNLVLNCVATTGHSTPPKIYRYIEKLCLWL